MNPRAWPTNVCHVLVGFGLVRFGLVGIPLVGGVFNALLGFRVPFCSAQFSCALCSGLKMQPGKANSRKIVLRAPKT